MTNGSSGAFRLRSLRSSKKDRLFCIKEERVLDTPDGYYDLYSECWVNEPEKRHTIEYVYDTLENLLKNDGKKVEKVDDEKENAGYEEKADDENEEMLSSTTTFESRNNQLLIASHTP